MGMPVKLSDDLVRVARKAASESKRSITAQVEYWASVGRAAERSMPRAIVGALAHGKNVSADHPVLSFFERISEASARMQAEKKLSHFVSPRYEADSKRRGGIVAVYADGRRVRGRWDMKRNAFVPARSKAKRRG